MSQLYTTFLLFLLLSVFATTTPLTAQRGKALSSSIANSATVREYGDELIVRLNDADLFIRKGMLQEALIELDKALMQQPDWIPALIHRAEILTLMGRREEADDNLRRADRLNRTAKNALMSYRMRSPLRYLAMYPQVWISQEYDIPVPDILTIESEDRNVAPIDIDLFDLQYKQVILTPDTSSMGRLLRDLMDSRVNDIPPRLSDYLGEVGRQPEDPLVNMMAGNISMLNREPELALYHYTMAIEQGGEFWPELYYNRGLILIFMNRYPAGCENLIISSDRGFRPAQILFNNLCNF